MNFRNIFILPLFFASICISTPSNAVGFGELLQNLGSSILKKDESADSLEDADTLKVSPQVLKQQAERERQVKNSLKATKTPPQSSAWTKIYAQRELVFYYDPTLIKQDGLHITIPYLVDLPVPNEINLLTDGRHKYKSVISVINYDCSRRSPPPVSERYWRTEDHFFFTENMAKGEAMMDPTRDPNPTWIAGFQSNAMPYEGGDSGNVSQGYFINKVLNPELKICKTYWKAPEGYEPPKPAPYTQITLPECKGADMWGWSDCYAITNKGRKDPHFGSDLVFQTPGQYMGGYIYGSPNGFGIYLIQGGPLAGDIYVGFFDSGNFSGYGSYYHKANNKLKGSTYFGHFYQHKKKNSGIYTFADGSPTQEGLWDEDKFVKPRKTFLIDTIRGLPMCQGKDATKWNDCFGFMQFETIPEAVFQKRNGFYAGGFKDGLPHGYGSLFGKNKSLDYQGEFKAGKFDGQGTQFFDWYGSEYYSGGFINDKRHGKGVMRTGGGSQLIETYEGDFENGNRSGQGTLFSEKNFTYVGGFKQGRFEGYGVYTPEKIPGREVVAKEGIWKNGSLQKPEAAKK